MLADTCRQSVSHCGSGRLFVFIVPPGYFGVLAVHLHGDAAGLVEEARGIAADVSKQLGTAHEAGGDGSSGAAPCAPLRARLKGLVAVLEQLSGAGGEQ